MAGSQTIYTRHNKYRVVGKLLAKARGKLLDIGARDRRLLQELTPDRLHYHSADVDPGHDLQLNLEGQLDVADRHFDYVVALDVLEHTENIHHAFAELARITERQLIIALPCMSTLYRRFLFLRHGHFGTKKYDLCLRHQGDRHRWLTLHPQIHRFIEANAAKHGFRVVQVYEEIETGFHGAVGFALGLLAKALMKAGFFKGLFSGRCIHILEREGGR